MGRPHSSISSHHTSSNMLSSMEPLQIYITLFLAFLLSVLLFLTFFTGFRSSARLPPGPTALPIIGHLHLLGQSPHRALQNLSDRYGPLLHLRLGSVPCVVASSPDTAKEFLKTQEASFPNRPYPSVVNFLSYPASDFTFAELGPYWRLMKKLCVSQLLGTKTLDRLLPVRRDEVKRLLDLMLERAGSRENVDVGREVTRLSSNVISRMIMSRRCSGKDDEADVIRTVVNESTDVLGKFNLSDYVWVLKGLDLQGIWKRSKEIHDKFDQIMEKIINEREQGEKVNDLLDMLLERSDGEIEGSEIRLTREHIKAFVLDVLVAGTDTSSLTIEWALSELINHPNAMNKARQELDSVVGKTRLVEESDIPDLPYVQAIVKETLRLHPPGPLLFREAAERCQVNGYDIAKNTRVLVNVWAINRDSELWESPLEFKPERFLESGNSELDVRGQSFRFLPFGSGRRGCPGASLGLHVVQATLAAMIQWFEWETDGEVSMEEGHGMTLPRAHPLVCVPVVRLSPFSFGKS